MNTNHLIPVDVVVDTWNLRGQALDVLGTRRFPTASGIQAGLRRMGFSVEHVYFAVASQAYSDNPSGKVQAALTKTEPFAERVRRDRRGTLLEGRLTDRSGDLEEKLVDVLCAIQIVRSAMEIATSISSARAIVVISEDIDLTPAFEMARQFGVPVYAAANETVHTRPGDWLVLSDGVMIDFCGRPNGDVGAQRKTTVAKQVTSGRTSRNYSFKYVDSATGDLVFSHRTGVEGYLPASEARRPFKVGDSESFYPVDLRQRSHASFPELMLSRQAPANDWPQNLVSGEVVEWRQPTRVRVRKSTGGERVFEAAPGTLLPGMRVALHYLPNSRPRLIGGLDRVGQLHSWSSCTEPRVATVEQDAQSRGAAVRASVRGLVEAVALLPPGEDTPTIGDRYAVVPREQDGGRVTKVLAVSSILTAAEVTPIRK